jgi:hypothetical protein
MTLRRGRIARVVVSLGTLSLVALYAAPIALAFVLPPAPKPNAVNPLATPRLRFPVLEIPKLVAPRPTVRPASKAFIRPAR